MPTVRARVTRFLDTADRPAVKQVPSAAAFVLANVFILLPGQVGAIPTNVGALVAADALVAVATLLAFLVPWERHGRRVQLAVPLLTIAGMIVLRLATGGAQSPYGGLLLIPIVWIASEPGRRSVAVVLAAVAVNFALPYLVGQSQVGGAQDWIRVVFSPITFTIAAALINQLSAVSRARQRRADALLAERDDLIESLAEAARAAERSTQEAAVASRLMNSVWDAITEQAIIGTDLDGVIDVWNGGAAQMLGYGEQQALSGMRIVELHLREEVLSGTAPGGGTFPGRFAALTDVARDGSADVRDWTYRRRDGSTFPALVATTQRTDAMGRPSGFIFVATDQTKAKEIERLKDEFSGLISHELRTPLSSILGYAELLRLDDDPPLSAPQQKYLGIVERNAKRLLQLVGDLLFTAQVEAGRFSIESSSLDVTTLLRAAADSARPQAEKAGIEVELGQYDAQLRVSADPTRLSQAVDNLVSNAVKFTKRGGRVTLSARREGARILITVTDTGVGIPADEVDRLSERFFRASTATKNAVQGVGLGLTITKAIAAAHGGNLTIESVEGEGTSITIGLPG
ncbi:ATP-binding protein [Herbiconiux sp. UC225_62]|uniref:PAS domain-containing sensor histidine kinase n=1 Tax=Herbiconiux sp. UC225_62 TaxID=3350168 RepID=UPI0036D2711D